MNLVSIDPGVNDCGVAVWMNQELLAATLIRSKKRGWLYLIEDTILWICNEVKVHVQQLVIEIPQVYTQHKQKGDPNSLIKLAEVAGGLEYAFWDLFEGPDITRLKPHQWKGQTDKSVQTMRTMKKLTAAEHKRVELPRAKSLHHNIWDSVGIGLYHLRRYE